MPSNTKQSSAELAKQAAETLRNPHASEIAKSFAGSVLAQASTGKQTGKAMETRASNALKSEKYSEETRSLAASLVSQSDKKR